MYANIHRPPVDTTFAEELAKKFYHFGKISYIKEMESYMDRNFYIRGERRENTCTNEDKSEQFSDNNAEEGEYVLKILNSFDSKHEYFVSAENEAMLFLRERNFLCPLPYTVAGSSAIQLNVHVPCSVNLTDEACNSINADDNRESSTAEKCIMRLLSFLPGVTAAEFGKYSDKNLVCIGQFVGQLSRNLQELQCPLLRSKLDRWSIENFLSLKEYLTFVKGEESNLLIRGVLGRFETHVIPKLSLLRRGILHNDVTRSNLVLDRSNDSFEILGIIDFGDIRHSCLLLEMVNTVASFIDENHVLIDSGHLITGYQAIFPLTDAEFALLYDMISVRLCQVCLITSKETSEYPENKHLQNLLMEYETKMRAWLTHSEESVLSYLESVGLGVHSDSDHSQEFVTESEQLEQ